jgi:autotransporter-associated beta strand protein
MVFDVAATAGNATFVIDGAISEHTSAGLVEFFNGSTAANGTFTVNGGSGDSANGGDLTLFHASGGTSTMTANGGTAANAGGGQLQFLDNTDAGNATLIANGGTNGGLPGTIFFSANSRGGKARVEVFGTGNVDLSYRPPKVGLVVGSIEGDGVIFLEGNELSVGSTNRSTTFSGTLKDGGVQGGTGGSLRKRGSGKLSLTGANTYTGETTVEGGTLFVQNLSGSGTGTGAVQVNRGGLGGNGTIAGTVTLSPTTGRSALLIPGTKQSLGALTIQKTLTFNAGATYDFALNSNLGTADLVIANGVTIASGAIFAAVDNGNTLRLAGTTFTPIRNTAAAAINGRFGNLADGSTVTVGVNKFQVSYSGGDGNDLTLTVVP